jgi:hypothetical protein
MMKTDSLITIILITCSFLNIFDFDTIFDTKFFDTNFFFSIIYMQEILYKKIKYLKDFLLTHCQNEIKKILINQKFEKLQFHEIVMFCNFLNHENIDKEIDTFILLFEIYDTELIRNELKR